MYSPAIEFVIFTIFHVFSRYRSIAGKHIKNRPHTLQCFADFLQNVFGRFLRLAVTQSTHIPREPQCLSPCPNWDSPTPSPPSECVPLPPGTIGGNTHSHACEGGGGAPIRTTGEKALHSVYSVLLVIHEKSRNLSFYFIMLQGFLDGKIDVLFYELQYLYCLSRPPAPLYIWTISCQ
jgi:hypothetical protein